MKNRSVIFCSTNVIRLLVLLKVVFDVSTVPKLKFSAVTFSVEKYMETLLNV